jgi:RNA polymerase sigma-54 factor
MKQTLSLKLGQQLTMTPQLQQAIRLLQLSALDLEQEVLETLETNPLLELDEDTSGDGATDEAPDNDSAPDTSTDAAETSDAMDDFVNGDAPEPEDLAPAADPSEMVMEGEAPAEPAVSDEMHEPMGDDLPVDSSWEDVYPTATGTASGPDSDGEGDYWDNNAAAETLTDHLLWQLNLTPMAPSDRIIAMAIIDAIDANGFLTMDVASITEGLQGSDQEVDEGDVLEILERVQEFDPVGVGARDLRECLLLQLDQLDARTPWVNEACDLVEHHLDLLGAKDFATLVRKTKLPEETLSKIVGLIRSLNPRPGSAVASPDSDYIIPDVIVKKAEGRWLVELNPEAVPAVRINSVYAGFAKSAKSADDRAYLRDNLQEARWFLKSLQTRHDTLLRVATKIVEVQRGFLDYGPEAMKPLILADIADAVDLHESTISRVTSRKYMATPRGVFELKYFFSSHVGTSTGGEVSSTAIRALIQKLTAEENPRKPLSDSKIAAILQDQNIKVARRTVAKYRESLAIPPSNERKQLV